MRHDTRVVLAAADLSDRGAATVACAAHLARRLDRPLRIVHAVNIPAPVRTGAMAARSIERLLRAAHHGTAAQAAAVLLAYPGLDVRTAVIVGRPDKVIVDAARDAFVTVVGIGDHRPDRLLTRVPGPVVAVPAGAHDIGHGPIVVGVRANRMSGAGTAFATALLGGHPSYLVTVCPGGEGEVNLESGALPVDRLVIRVVAAEHALASAVAGVAAEYTAALVVLERRSARWALRSDGAAAVHAVADAAACPVALIDPWFAARSDAPARVAGLRARSVRAHGPRAAVG